MANPIANHLFVYGPQHQLDLFFGSFLRAGMWAHDPIPPDAEPLEDPETNMRTRWEQISYDHWGTRWIGPDIYWSYGKAYGVSMLAKGLEQVFKPDEHQLIQVRKLDLTDKSESNNKPARVKYFNRPVWVSWSELPGCVPPLQDDAILYCKFYSTWTAPFKWFGKVATDLHGSGLRFVMDSIDLANLANDGSHEVMHHWSVDGPGDFYQGGHWAARVEPADLSDDDDECLHHVNESAEIVRERSKG